MKDGDDNYDSEDVSQDKEADVMSSGGGGPDHPSQDND